MRSGEIAVSKRDLTVAEYLCHMGRAVVEANVAAMKALRASRGALRTQAKIGKRTLTIDGVTVIPEGWHCLDEFEIECESAVRVSRDEDGEPTGLAILMSRGLLRRGMHVKFRAQFSRTGTVEAVEILRDAANEALRKELVTLKLVTSTGKE